MSESIPGTPPKEEQIASLEKNESAEREAMEKVIPIFDTPGLLYHSTGDLEVAPILYKGILSHELARRAGHQIRQTDKSLLQEQEGMEKISCWDPYSAIGNKNLWLNSLKQNHEYNPEGIREKDSGEFEFISSYSKYARERTKGEKRQEWEERIWEQEVVFTNPQEVADALRHGYYRPFYAVDKPMVIVNPAVERTPKHTYYGTEVVVNRRIRPEDIIGLAVPEMMLEDKLTDLCPEILNPDYSEYLDMINEYRSENDFISPSPRFYDYPDRAILEQKWADLGKRCYKYMHFINFDSTFLNEAINSLDEMSYIFSPEELEKINLYKIRIAELKLPDHDELDKRKYFYANKDYSSMVEDDEDGATTEKNKNTRAYEGSNEPSNQELKEKITKMIAILREISQMVVPKIEAFLNKPVENATYFDFLKTICRDKRIPLYTLGRARALRIHKEDDDPFTKEELDENGRLVWPQEMSYPEIKEMKGDK